MIIIILSEWLTHLTTNLNSGEIEKQYGLRVRSRLREMFNLVAFPEDAVDDNLETVGGAA
jgi:hypothetical protein